MYIFQNRIGYWAKIKGVKHKYLAERCEVTPQTFSSWVKNNSQPDLKQSSIIARILDISTDDLVNLKEENENGQN